MTERFVAVRSQADINSILPTLRVYELSQGSEPDLIAAPDADVHRTRGAGSDR